MGLLLSQRDVHLQQELAMERTAFPPSILLAGGRVRVSTGKSTLKTYLKVEVSERLSTSPTAIVVAGSAVLWTVDWPAHGAVEMLTSDFKVWLSVRLLGIDVHWSFDRYHDYSTKRPRVALGPMQTPIQGRSCIDVNFKSNTATVHVRTNKHFASTTLHSRLCIILNDYRICYGDADSMYSSTLKHTYAS